MSSVQTLISLLHLSLFTQVSNEDVYTLSCQRLNLIRFRGHCVGRGEDGDAIKVCLDDQNLICDGLPDHASCAND